MAPLNARNPAAGYIALNPGQERPVQVTSRAVENLVENGALGFIHL
jgi:hypothetical protein